MFISDRYYWKAEDPMNVCEGVFAVANVLSFCRLFYLLAANETMGPLQISLLRMITVSVILQSSTPDKMFLIYCAYVLVSVTMTYK